MKKTVILLTSTLLLAACSLLSGTDCGIPNQDMEWKGLSFTQPGCWVTTDLGTALVLVNEDETNSVIFSSEAPDNLNLRSDLQIYENTAGEVIYVSIGDPFIDADEVALVTESITIIPSTETITR